MYDNEDNNTSLTCTYPFTWFSFGISIAATHRNKWNVNILILFAKLNLLQQKKMMMMLTINMIFQLQKLITWSQWMKRTSNVLMSSTHLQAHIALNCITLEDREHGRRWYGILALLSNVVWELKSWHFLKDCKNLTPQVETLRCHYETFIICIVFEDSNQKVTLLMLHNMPHRALILLLLIKGEG